MKNTTVLFILAFMLSACAPSLEVVNDKVNKTLAAIPTSTSYPTFTPLPTLTTLPSLTANATYTPAATLTLRVIVVTATFTATPLLTATITQTPTKTMPPTPTLNPLQANKGPGKYLIGVDIAPGIWRSLAKGDNCYWKVSTKTGNIISNDFGAAGGTMYIPATAFQAEMTNNCGEWSFLSSQ